MEDDKDEEEILGPYELPTRNNIARRYHRKDDTTTMEQEEEQEEEPSRRNEGDETMVVARNVNDNDDEEEDWDDSEDDPIFQQRIYESPRLIADDSEIFPPSDCHAILYHDYRQRWETIAQQAGPHRQDGTSLVIPRRMSPRSFQKGIMAQYVATRVKRLSLWLDHTEDILPQWLDVIAQLFPNLEHLALSQDMFYGEEEIEVSARMRRLYILYRLPGLLSIDDAEVTRTERNLARPSTPNGERVKRDDWMNKKSSLLDEEEEEFDDEEFVASTPRDIHTSESIGDRTATELGAELAHLTQQIAVIHDDDNDQGTMQKVKNSISMDDSLDGERLLDLVSTSVSSSQSGEQREDLCSSDKREQESYDQHQQAPPSFALHEDMSMRDAETLPNASALESNSRRKSVVAPSRFMGTRHHHDDQIMNTARNIQRDLLTKPSTADDTLDLVSVASSHHEWSAACGVLSFRSGCTPKLRLNFCGRGNRLKRIAANNNKNDVVPVSNKKESSESMHAKQQQPQPRGNDGSPSSRTSQNASVRSPLRDHHDATGVYRESSPLRQPLLNARSANQKLPPSKSLSSPFPMQFRERTSSLRISTAENDLTAKDDEQEATVVVPSSPRAKGSIAMDTITKPMTLTVLNQPSSPPRKKTAPGMIMAASSSGNNSSSSNKSGLPPPCPAPRRKVGAASLLQRQDSDALLLERKQARRARKMEKRKRLFQEKSRSTSVLDDLMDDDDDSSGSSSDEDGDRLVDMLEIEDNYSSIHHASEW